MDDEGNAEMDEDQLDAASASPPFPFLPPSSRSGTETDSRTGSSRTVLYLGFAFVKADEQGGAATASVEEVPAA